MKHPLRPTGRYLGATGVPGEGDARAPQLFRPPRRALEVLAALLLLSTFVALPAAAQQAGSPADNAMASPVPSPPPAAAPGDNAASSPEATPPPAGVSEPAPPPAAPTGSIKEIVVTKTPHYTNIEAIVEGKIGNYNSFKLNDPFRIVVDVWGITQGGAAPVIEADTPQVKSVKVSQQDDKLRILVETPEDRPLPFLVNAESDRLILSVGGGEEEKVTSMTRPEAAKAAAGAKAVVGIDLEDFADVASVVVTTTGDVPVRTFEKKGKVTLRFEGASAARNLLRAMDAEPMGIPIRKVLPSKVKKGIDVAILFAPGAAYKVDKRGKVVVVSFPKKPGGAKGSVVAELKEKRGPAPSAAMAGPGASAGPAGEEGIGPGAAPAAEAEAKTPEWGFVTYEGGGGRKFVGQRISLDFKDADLANVFRIIADVSNLNIITTDDVKGKVSLRLINVPWDQALDIVLKSKGLGARQEGNILRIAPLATLRAEEKARLDARKEVEKLQASLEGVVETIPVNYGKASELQGKIKDLLSEGGKVQIDDRTNTIVVRDLRKNVEEIKALIATLDTPIPQVLIEARIVEVDTSFSRELGVQWGGIKQGTANGYGWGVSGYQDASGAFISGLPISNTPSPFETANYAVNLPAAVGQGSGGGISFGIFKGSFRLDVSLTAMEASGKGKVVSSPKVVTIDNREAVIEQGTQIPYSTVSASGTNTQFVDATLSLKVTPHITPEGSVIMKVEAKNDSQGATGATGQPAINKKKATTEVLVRDGETAVIGGILQITRNDNEQAVPWLSKIPVLGYFFRKDTASTSNRELLIFITPKILKQEPAQAKTS
ncbi:MAG: type IV pilus secretin PilQ [Gemmatimonadota bacterium]